MNLVKWFRKNKTKALAIVTVVLMIAFIGGSALTNLLSSRRALGRRAVAYFGDNKKITENDLKLAYVELEILRLLRAGDVLRSQDLKGILLAELLFSEDRASAPLINRLKQIIRANQYRISDKQIIDIYRRSMPSNIYWYCLEKEAQLAGIRIANDEAGQLLARAIPQLFNGQTYSQRMSQLVNQHGIPEAQILATFGKLLAVFQYAQLICSTEDVTSSQVMHIAGFENETIDVEFVKFDSAIFAETDEKLREEEMLEHFNKYKNFFAGDVSEENPYGFGYKLPNRIQLEYIAVKLDDISSLVSPPTSQETEEYYQKHTEQFTESVPQDPNDPNSPSIERTRSYAEVASFISRQLLKDKINSKAENILQQARTITEAGLQDIEPENVSAEPPALVFDKKTRGGDYQAAAQELAKKHNIKIYVGQTGLLSAADMEQDEYLRRLYILSRGRDPVRLTQVVFSIEQLQADTPTSVELIDVQKPKMYENIGLVRDYLGEIMTVVRVTKAEKASEPETLDLSYSKRAFRLDADPSLVTPDPNDDIYSVKEKVTQDLKKLAAIQQGLVRSKAEEFIDLVAKDGWNSALDKFNELYGHEVRETSDPNVFKLENLTNLQRISSKQLGTLAAQSAGNLTARLFVNKAKVNRQFIDQLYLLLPPDSNTVDSLPVVMEFKPNLSFYVIKSISVKRLGQQEYEKIKGRKLLTEDHIQTQSLVPVHFNPENILKRMNFRPAGKEQKQTESATADESEDTS